VSDRRILWLLAAAALAVHAGFVLHGQADVVFRIPLVDAASYLNQAAALAAGESPPAQPFWQPPLYPYLLAALVRATGGNVTALRLMQGLCGAAVAVLVYRLARAAAPRPVAAAAAAASILYGPLLLFNSRLLPTGPAVALGLLTLWCWTRLDRSPNPLRGLLAGLSAGVTALTVANILALVPVMLAGLLVRAARARRATPFAPAAGALLAGVLLAVLPVTIRNRVVAGQWVLLSTNAGINLYIGNNPAMERTLAVRPGIDWDRLAAIPYRAGARNAAEADRMFRARVLAYAAQRPAAFAAGLRRKAAWALNAREMPRNVDLYAFRRHAPLLRPLVWRAGGFAFPLGLVLPLALWGAAAATRRRALPWTYAAYALVYGASVVLFFPASRYLLPVAPVLLIGAAGGAADLWALRGRERALGLAAVAAAAVLVNLPLPLPTDTINAAAELHRLTGVGLQTRGRTADAIAQYRAALALEPRSADTHRYLATALRARGDTAGQMQHLRRAVALRPDHDAALQDLAVALYRRGRVEDAVALLRRVLELNPDNRNAMKNLAVGLLHLKREDEARLWLRRAGVLDSGRRKTQNLPPCMRDKPQAASGTTP